MKARRAYVRFLEREVYTFAGSRRNAVGPHFFLFVGGPQETTWGRRWTGRGWVAGGMRESSRAEQCGRSDTQRCAKKGRKMFFGERLEGCLLCPLGGGRDRAAAIAALGMGTAAKTVRAGCGTGWEKTQLMAACGRRPSLSSLYTLDTYVGA